jgi:hypothetical protein
MLEMHHFSNGGQVMQLPPTLPDSQAISFAR